MASAVTSTNRAAKHPQRPHGHILKRGEMREEVETLKYHADLLTLNGNYGFPLLHESVHEPIP